MTKSPGRVSISALGLCLSVLAVTASAQGNILRGITPEDYYSFEFVSDPNISPDAKLVAYVVTKIDRAQNRRNSSIWMAAIDQALAPWQFTTSPQSSTSPRWSPDGKWLAFLSPRSSPESTSGSGATTQAAAPQATGSSTTEPPRNQVYLLSMSGGEAR